MAGGHGSKPHGQGEHARRLLTPGPAGSRPLRFGADAQMHFGFPGRGTNYRAKVIGSDGTVHESLPVGGLSEIGDRKMAAGTCRWTGPAKSAGAQAITAADFRQLLVTKGTSVVFAGPITDWDVDAGGMLNATAYRPWWWLGRRHIGPAGRTNLLVDPTFADGAVESLTPPIGRWIATRTAGLGFGDVAGAVTVSSTVRRPGQSWSIRGAATANDPTDRLRVTQAVYVDGGTFGRQVDFVAWHYIPSGTYSPPTPANSGLILTITKPIPQWTTAPPAGYFTENLDHSQSTVTADHPTDTWERHATSIWVPPGQVRVVFASCQFAPAVSHWADAALYKDEALEYADADPYDIADGIVDHLQGLDGVDGNKGDLSIRVTGPGSFGETISRRYPHHQHINGAAAIQELADEGFFEWEMLTDDGTNHYLNLYRAKTDRRYRPQMRFRLTERLSSPNIAGLRLTWQGSSAANVITALGIGDGISREEAAAVDLAAYDGSVAVEEVFVASEAADGNALARLADQHLDVTKDPHVLEIVGTPGCPQTTGLRVGQTTDVYVVWGALSIDDRYEVVGKRLDPHTDKPTFTLNPARAA